MFEKRGETLKKATSRCELQKYLIPLFKKPIKYKRFPQSFVPSVFLLLLQSSEAVVRRCSYKFHKIHRKTPVLEQSLFLIKLQAWGKHRYVQEPATLLEKTLWHWCFHVNFAKFLRRPSFREQLRWLLLKVRSFFQKNSVTNVLWKSCLENFPKIQKKTNWLKPLFLIKLLACSFLTGVFLWPLRDF